METLVSFFSASGVTKKEAEKLAKLIDADLFEIKPKKKYTEKDLNWMDSNSRSSVEMKNRSYRPEIVSKVANLSQYDKVAIGFPVWWYTAPTIINTFIEENDLTNKDVYVFVTSGGSNYVSSFEDLQKTYPKLHFIRGIRLTGKENEKTLLDFIK